MNSSDNGSSALLRAYQREASLGFKTLRQILWEKSWILDENCDEKLNNYPKSKTQINSFIFNKNAAKLELSLKTEAILLFFNQIQYVKTVSHVVVFWFYLPHSQSGFICANVKNDSAIIQADKLFLFWKPLRGKFKWK